MRRIMARMVAARVTGPRRGHPPQDDQYKEYHVKDDSGEMDDEDGCNQADGDKEYRGEDRITVRRKTRRTAARRTAVTRSTAVWTTVVRPTGPRQGRM